jgi:uncharacterized protein
MLGFSLPKLIFTILVIVVVIYGFKAITRLQARREAGGGQGDAPAPRDSSTAARGAAKPTSDGSEDMVACSVCGTYVASSGARSCGRGDCPYPG